IASAIANSAFLIPLPLSSLLAGRTLPAERCAPARGRAPPSGRLLRRVEVLLELRVVHVRPRDDGRAGAVVLLDPGLVAGHVLVRELDAQLADPVRVLRDERVDRAGLERLHLRRARVELDELHLAGLAL